RVLDINEVIREMERMLGRLIGEHIRLETRLADEPCRVRADRGQIDQVLVNLVVNARDAMPEGGLLTIQTEGLTVDPGDRIAEAWEVEPGPVVRITVADTGVGMDEETLGQIFDPFFTTKEEGKGTGLGLSTVFGIVHQSGGHVVAESEPGEGTRVTVYLPRWTAGESEPPEGPDRVAAPPESASTAERTVLVVEDQAAVRALAARVIERAGHTVITAANGREALAALDGRVAPVDMVLTDMVMPEMGGRELARHLRERWPELPILFMSGYDDELADQGAEDSEFLAKPFTPAVLARRVAEILTPRA
ncbi:MAG: ATP-binding protein, partial [Longimicrobiales bacterium]